MTEEFEAANETTGEGLGIDADMFDLDDDEHVGTLIDSLTTGQCLEALGKCSRTLHNMLKGQKKLAERGFFEVFNPTATVELDLTEASIIVGALLALSTISATPEERRRVLALETKVAAAADKANETATEEQVAQQAKIVTEMQEEEAREQARELLRSFGMSDEDAEKVIIAADEESARLAALSDEEIGPAH